MATDKQWREWVDMQWWPRRLYHVNLTPDLELLFSKTPKHLYQKGHFAENIFFVREEWLSDLLHMPIDRRKSRTFDAFYNLWLEAAKKILWNPENISAMQAWAALKGKSGYTFRELKNIISDVSGVKL